MTDLEIKLLDQFQKDMKSGGFASAESKAVGEAIHSLLGEIWYLRDNMKKAHERISRDINEPDKIFIHLDLLKDGYGRDYAKCDG